MVLSPGQTVGDIVLVATVRVIVYMLFLSIVSLVFVPVAMLSLIYIDPFVGRIIAVLVMSFLLTFEVLPRYRLLTAIVLPQAAFFLAFGDHFGTYVSLFWIWIVAMNWPRDQQP